MTASLEIRLLGPFEVLIGVRPAEVTGRDYVLEEGPPDYGRAIGGNILTLLRRVE